MVTHVMQTRSIQRGYVVNMSWYVVQSTQSVLECCRISGPRCVSGVDAGQIIAFNSWPSVHPMSFQLMDIGCTKGQQLKARIWPASNHPSTESDARASRRHLLRCQRSTWGCWWHPQSPSLLPPSRQMCKWRLQWCLCSPAAVVSDGEN